MVRILNANNVKGKKMKRKLFSMALAGTLGFGVSALPAQASDTLTIKGSDTMIIMIQREAEEFMKGSKIIVQATGGGSGTGISALINGTSDIAMASRPMKKKEFKQIKKKYHTDAVETATALDGITIYINEKNRVKSLSTAQLKDIYTGKVNNWKEVGGSDAKIIRYCRENNSGTYAFLKEHVLKKEDYAADCAAMPGTASVVNAVSKDVGGIGYGGAAYAAGVIKLLVSKDGGKAYGPEMKNIVSGDYPISRKLYLYTIGAPQANAKAFIDFVLSPKGQKIVEQVGYFPLP